MPYIPINAVSARPKKPNWFAPTLSGATNVGGAYVGARYTKSPDGIVTVQGWITVTTADQTVLFILPAGMRPSTNLIFGVPCRSSAGAFSIIMCEVLASGGVRYPAGIAASSTLLLNLVFPGEV